MVLVKSVSAITLRTAGLKFSLFALALVTMLLPVAVSAQQTFTGAAIAVGRTQTTPSSGTITISSPTGSSIASLKIVLNGLTTDGTDCSDGNCWSLLTTSFYLKAPNGGPKLVLLGGTGDGIDGDDAVDAGSGLNNATITIQDGANPAPNDTPWTPKTGSFTVKPSSYFLGAGQTPPLGSEADFPQTDGSATLTSRFGGIGIANGDVWTLEIENGEGLTTPINISSWQMIVTYASTTPTSTVVSSNQNPAFTTSPNNTVSLTATVSTSGTPTGTVAFTDNGATISGCGAVTLSGDQAVCNTTFAQGYHPISAGYSGGGGFGQSSGSLTQLVEVHPTQSGNTWCNPNSFSAVLNGTPIAYPAMIPVSGYSAGATVGNVTLELENVTEGAAGAGIEAEFLLVGPGGTNNLDFLDSAFNTDTSAVNLFISDSAGLSPTQGTAPVNNQTYLPFDGNTQTVDSFPASNSPIVDSNIPSVPGTINYAAPHGKTNAFTLQQAFSGAPANGDWALYATASNGSDALGVGGWCITLDVNSGIGSTTSLTSSAQRASFGSNVTLTATVAVQGTSTPITSGTVEFKDETTGAILASANPLNGSGVAAVTVSNLAEGDHKILASYSGTGSFNTSFATIYQRIDHSTAVTTVSSNQWMFCNPGAITLPEGSSGAETPNPSNIFVSNLPGNLQTATLQLTNFSILVGDQLDNTESLVVGPTGAALDFFSNTADGTIEDEALAGNYVFADSASSLVPSGSGNLNPGTYKPTSYVGTDNANDVFTADPGGFYALPGTFGYSASRGTSTFTNKFGATNPNGTWSLYFNSPNANLNGTGAAGGWCVNLTETVPTVTVTVPNSSVFSQGQADQSFTVNITNSGTTGPTGDPTGGSNPITVTDTLNAAFTFDAAGSGGTGWSCSATGQNVSCTNDSAVADDGGTYPALTIAVNVSPTATGTITNSVSASGAGVSSTASNTDSITIDVPPAITSAAGTTFTIGTNGSFTVTTTGTPAPALSESGGLPSGVTFTDNGNGTATIAGTPAIGSGGNYAITITANNGTTNATQNFTLTVNQAPAITSAAGATFTSGTLGTFTVTTSGSPTSALSESGAMPPGVNFIDNGNGTATITGTAALATSYPITITASNGVAPNATQSFTLTVNPGLATHLTIPGGPEPFYTAFSFNIFANDAAGNIATSYNGTVAFTSSDPGFVNLGPVTLVNGVGSQTGVLKTAGTDSITATDTTNPSITGTGFFTIQPGVATHLGLTAPASTNVGAPITLTLTAYDLFGNVATSYGGTVVFNSTDPSAILPGSSAITNGTGTFSVTMGTAGSQTITATDAANSLSATTGNISVTIPMLVVTTATDDAGTMSNCTLQATPGTGTDASCSLRDALLFAANAGSASITFDSTAFASTNSAAANTITLSTGTLTLPSDTTVSGPTSGTGATLANLVTVDGGGAANNFPIFTTNPQGTNSVIANLTITHGNNNSGTGAGIVNGFQAVLTVMNSTIEANSAPGGTGAIFNDFNATLNVTGSTIANNSGGVGGIENESGGTVTVKNSTISGNASTSSGGGIVNSGAALTVTSTTISGNSATFDAGGILSNSGTLALANTIVSLNSAPSNPDVDGTVVDNGGNQIGASGIGLSTLASFGGPTQTLLALPGSTAICSGTAANATAAGLTTDQRGLPFDPMCPSGSVDAGAVQTNYALIFNPALVFTPLPPSGVLLNQPISPAPDVQLTESGVLVAPATNTVTMSDTAGLLTGTLTANLSSGSASFSNLIIPTATPSDALIATLPLTASINLTVQSPTFQAGPSDTPVQLISPTPGSVLPGPNVTFTFSTGVSATRYYLWLGTTPGASDITNAGPRFVDSLNVVGIPTNGETIYARLFTNLGGPMAHTDYTFTAATQAVPTSPAANSVLPGPTVTFNWSAGTGSGQYYLWLGNTGAGSMNLYQSSILSGTSVTVNSLPTDGETIYARLFTSFNGVLAYTDYTFMADTAAVLTSPTPGGLLTGPATTFTWTTVPTATSYYLWLGSGGAGTSDLYNSGAKTGTSLTVTGLPSNGETIYARLFTKFNNRITHLDYTYTAVTPSSMTSPTQGSVLSGASVPFSWASVPGATGYYLWVGSGAPGTNDLFHSGDTGATTITVNNLPTNGETIYVRLFTNFNGALAHVDYTYTAAP